MDQWGGATIYIYATGTPPHVPTHFAVKSTKLLRSTCIFCSEWLKTPSLGMCVLVGSPMLISML